MAMAPGSKAARASSTWSRSSDAASRRILGFTLSERHDAQSAYGALAMALAVRGGQVPGVVFHTGHGSEYTARVFRAACERLNSSQSMGRPGSAR